jgi:hypothetical protein
MNANIRISAGLIIVFTFLLLEAFPAAAMKGPEGERNYSHLLDFIAKPDLQTPLVLVEDHQGDFDKERNLENRSYLNDHPGLLTQIQHKLNGDTIQWELAGSSRRVLAVPESREDYAHLFESYCNDAIDYVLDRLQLANPFADIMTLSADLSGSLTSPSQDGTIAYLVHNLAEEYVEEYLFFNPEKQGTKLKIKLSNKVYTGVIGSYSTQLVIDPDLKYEFIREPYTFWQNSASNPLNVLIVPVEETLHAALRESTEGAIQDQLKLERPKKVGDVQSVIDHWMAVEEAMVGGLVAQLMPDLLERFVLQSSTSLLADTLAERRQHDQYRFLSGGVQTVADLGIHAALDLYQTKPQEFAYLIRRDEAPSL